jgi:exopolysaccharide biosynthesis polyprenyl glycosylphosphotransferase
VTQSAVPQPNTARSVLEGVLRYPRVGAVPRAAENAVPWTSRYRAFLTLTDTVIIVAVTVVAFVVDGAITPLVGFTVGAISLWIVALEIYRSRSVQVVGMGPGEYKRVFSASAFTFGAVAVAGVASETGEVRMILLAFPVGFLAIILSRWLWRQWLISQRAKGRFLSRALIIGPEADVRDVAGRLGDRSRAYLVVGAVIDGHAQSTIPLGWRDVPVVSGEESIAEAVRVLEADTVIVAGHHSGDNGFVRRLGWSLEETSAQMVLASGLTDVAGPRIHMRPVEGLPLIHVELPTFDGGKHVIKRTFDIVLAALALLVLAPVFAVIALLVRFDSEGPVLFRQERVGKDGRTFKIVKFRSMVPTAESDLGALMAQNEGAGVLFKMKNDPRVTRLGAILRKHSLDELPQIWNILVGDMSIVGPRPPLPREVKEYEQDVSRRLYIKPGLTGLWQISGRSDLSWKESVRLDLYYVENWSLVGDLVIMWRTMKVLLGRSGAY